MYKIGQEIRDVPPSGRDQRESSMCDCVDIEAQPSKTLIQRLGLVSPDSLGDTHDHTIDNNSLMYSSA